MFTSAHIYTQFDGTEFMMMSHPRRPQAFRQYVRIKVENILSTGVHLNYT